MHIGCSCRGSVICNKPVQGCAQWTAWPQALVGRHADRRWHLAWRAQPPPMSQLVWGQARLQSASGILAAGSCGLRWRLVLPSGLAVADSAQTSAGRPCLGQTKRVRRQALGL